MIAPQPSNAPTEDEMGCVPISGSREPLQASAALLDEFRTRYIRDIAATVDGLLGSERRPFLGWLLAPVRCAHGRRRNFFRSAMLIESAAAAGCPEAAPMLSACAEIGWTCALILDDIVDRSSEREGGPSAHIQHGVLRSATAVACALLLIAWTLAARIPSPWRTRIGRLHLGALLVLRAARGALASSPHTLHAYARTARRVNSSIEWALLAPFCGLRRGEMLSALRGYAAHSSLAGKMRNDLLDYWGGSSERDAILEDLHRAKPTFPILVLLASPMAPEQRASVEDHFYAGRRMHADEIYRMFEAHSVRTRCIGILSEEIAASEVSLARLADLPEARNLDRLLRRWNRYMLEGCRLRLMDHS